jgi:hypothetical protein
LHEKFHHEAGKFPRHTHPHDLHAAFRILYIYDLITKYAGRKQKSHKIIGIKTFAIAGKARLNEEYPLRSKSLKLSGNQAYDSVTARPLHQIQVS